MSESDLVRVVYVRGFTDGLAGASFVDGVSDPIPRLRAARIATCLGARVVELDEAPWPDSLAEVAPPSDAAPAASPPDAPEVPPAPTAPPAPSPPPRHVPPPSRRR